MIVLVICVGPSKSPFVVNAAGSSSSAGPISSGRMPQGGLCAEDTFSSSPTSPFPLNGPASSNPFGVNVAALFEVDSREDPSNKAGSPKGLGSNVAIFNGVCYRLRGVWWT